MGNALTTYMKLKEVLYTYYDKKRQCKNKPNIHAFLIKRSVKHLPQFVHTLFLILVYYNSTKTCLSLQCSSGDPRYIPKTCTESLAKVCENMSKFAIINNSFDYDLNAFYNDKFNMAGKLEVTVIMFKTYY